MLNVKSLTDTMSRMPLPQLQQYAALHKNDPYVVTLALSIANQKKQMQAGKAGQVGMMPQPKVVDQQISDMAAVDPMGNVTGAQMLPEDTGIGQLPAQNMRRMAEGGIVAFDDGGSVPGYAEGVFTGLKKKYKELKGYEFEGGPEAFDKALDAEGITDPKQRAYLKSIHDKESNQAFKAPTRKDSGASGPMQVTERAWTDVAKKGEPLKDRNDPYDNMRAGIRYASVGWEKAGGDPALASTYYYGGQGGFNKAKKGQGVAALEDLGQTTLQYGQDVANRMAAFLPKTIVPVASTQAQFPTLDDQKRAALLNQIPGQTSTAPAVAAATPRVDLSQIPGQTSKAPPAKPEDTSVLSPGWFAQKAENVGLSPDVGRNVFNTVMAPTPLAPVTTLPKATSSGLGLAGLGEKIYNKFAPSVGMSQKEISALRAETEAARAAEAAQAGQLLPRLTPPAKAIEAGSETIPVSQAGEAVVQSAADLEKTRLANQAADQLAASQAAARAAQAAENLPSAAERLQQASYLREAEDAARLTAQAQAATNVKSAAQTAEGITALPSSTETPYVANTAAAKYPPGVMGGERLPSAEEGIIAALKEKPEETKTAEAPAAGGMNWGDLALKMGLNLLAGKSPNALQNIGEAGLATLGMQQAETKAKSEAEARLAEALKNKSMGRYYESYAAATERGAKEKNLELEAEKLIAQEMAKDKFLNMPGQEAARAARERQMRETIYRNLGITPTMAAGAPAGQRLIYNPETGKIG